MSPSNTQEEKGRVRVAGKFLFAGAETLYVRGVTYGTFRLDENGSEYHDPKVVERDFALMAASGLNAIRTYTVPPRWLLDAAQRYGLRVMVGLPWEQHVAFLDDRDRARSIEERVRFGVRACAGHPAVLCYAIGNEIPSPILRWHGRRRIERFLDRLYRIAKAEDPESLVTYVNYPSTEYLQLPFIDFVCFNVYLESQDSIKNYLFRLQNIAGDRPLVLTEIGLDSLRHGEETQARFLDWQIQTAFAAGCAGAFVFAWTDEWHRGGSDIEDWHFGLTDRNRQPKLALEVVSKAFAEVPFPSDLPWPHISVVVCSYNGASIIRDCCEGLLKLEYPNFEVIVVDDGSKDATAAIAREYGFRVISTENRGLSSARNTGLEAARGEIIAYTDDDARPDPHWLTYLAATFMNTTHAGAGGPNIAPPGDGLIADCIANAPGGPVHVLLSDQEAEHIPGCNMAFRKECLKAVGGFDPLFRVAGDDVDVCWRIRQRGWTLGFSPAAMVWHHRRNSVRRYWFQQLFYGKSEALLERKWPEKYNTAGHYTWAGRVYGKGIPYVLGRVERIYHGMWGLALFQSVYPSARNWFVSLSQMPEWYMIIIALATLSALGALWTPLLLALPLLVLAVSLLLIPAVLGAARASFTSAPRSLIARLKLYALTAFLHLFGPLARLRGRVRYALTPWRIEVYEYGVGRGDLRSRVRYALTPWRAHGMLNFSLPWPRTFTLWSESWQAADERLRSLEAALQARRAVVRRGDDHDRWDLEVRGRMLGSARVLMAIEEHGAGRQLVRFRTWPRCSPKGLVVILLFAALSAAAAMDQAWTTCVILGAFTLLLALRTIQECAAATGAVLHTLREMKGGDENMTRSSQQAPFSEPSAVHSSMNISRYQDHPQRRVVAEADAVD